MPTHPSPLVSGPGRRGAFDSTQWSLVLRAGAASESGAHAALETLCRAYWYPIYAFVRRQGRSHHEAEDLTQSFFAHLLASDGMARAEPGRGRFRSFLLSSVTHFLTDDWRRSHAARRGGGEPPVLLETAGASERYTAEPLDTGLTPHEAFDHHWAMSMIQQAIDELRAEYQRTALFETLGPHAWGGAPVRPQAEAAAALGMTEHAFTAAVHRLRRRLRDRLRAHVAETVAEPSEIENELRHLIAAVRR